MSRAVLDYAESSRISDMQSLRRVTDLKKSSGGATISSPELATALTLIDRNVAAYWECIRIFPSEFYLHGRTILPDFITNVAVNGRNLAVEYHSFAVKIIGVGHKFGEEALRHDLAKRKASYTGSSLIVVLASDMHPEALLNATSIDVMSFCDYYIDALGKAVVGKSGTTRFPSESFRTEEKSFESHFSSMFQRDPSSSSISLGNYNVLLSRVLLDITRNTAMIKHEGDVHSGAQWTTT